jgi:hypothetical protein
MVTTHQLRTSKLKQIEDHLMPPSFSQWLDRHVRNSRRRDSFGRGTSNRQGSRERPHRSRENTDSNVHTEPIYAMNSTEIYHVYETLERLQVLRTTMKDRRLSQEERRMYLRVMRRNINSLMTLMENKVTEGPLDG